MITSKENEFVKHLSKLKEKKYRDEYHEFIIEGIKMIEEALQEDAKIKKIFVSQSFLESKEERTKELYKKIASYEVIDVSDKIFETISDVKTPQGILAIIEKEDFQLQDIDFSQNNYLVLDDIQDPGNLGTIFRTIDSLNYKQIIVSKNTIEAYNPKVVRSTMGAIFRVKVIKAENLKDVLEKMREYGIKTYATSLSNSEDMYKVNFDKSCVIIGNEANGVSEELVNFADEKIKIPMPGKTESLNAAVATSIILYEIYRKQNY